MVVRTVYPSLEEAILKLSKRFPEVHFRDSAIKGHPPITTRCLFSWGVLRNSLRASTIFGARYSRVCNLCLGIRDAQSHYHCALSFLGCVRLAHTDSSAAHMGVCLWRAQRSVKKADESLCQGETGTRGRPGLQPAYCPENKQSGESLLSSVSLSALPWGH